MEQVERPERRLSRYLVRTDPDLIDIDIVHDYLSDQSYWAAGRTRDVANSLYMVLFDSVVNDRISVYLDFKEAFVDGYMADSAETSFDLDAIATFIDLRVNALHAWLSDSRSAPTGIRTATPQWRATLYQFVEHYRSQARP